MQLIAMSNGPSFSQGNTLCGSAERECLFWQRLLWPIEDHL